MPLIMNSDIILNFESNGSTSKAIEALNLN